MKTTLRWLGLLLAAFFVVTSQVATAQTPVTLTVYNPTGAFSVLQTFAPRLADLKGKTICEITDNMWQSDRTFALIRQLLQNQFPTAKFIPYEQFPMLNIAVDIPGLEDAVKAKGCQAAIIGNAA